jgi:penicillin-binding protein-related factor A (putative recombinase)
LSKNLFEDNFKSSATKDILVHRQRDVFLPSECRKCGKIFLPKNPFDFLLFRYPSLILCELKSTGVKSISLEEKIIKKHQSLSLLKYSEFNGVTCCFIFNFRNYDNKTYFLHIDDFIQFVKEGTRKSIPLAYCEEVGIEIKNKLLKSNYRYDLSKLFNDVNSKYLQGDES